MEEIKCNYCGKKTKKTRVNKKYCCKYCKKKANIESRKEETKIYNKNYYENNIKKIRKRHNNYTKLMRLNDEEFRIKELVRAETKRKFNGYKKDGCFKCKSKKYLEFHHFVYRIPVQEEDFTILCKKCHTKLHQFIKNH